MKNHNRREFITTCGSAAAALSFTGNLGAANASADKPNILWLVSEDNSPLLGCYGDEFADTPNLDRLAREGVRFTNAFANAPVCAPARSTLHTGMYPTTLGTQHMRSVNPMPDHIRFFTENLRAAGYHCINGNKTDYNTTGTPKGAWDGRSFTDSLRSAARHQPFFRFVNYMTTHESSLHKTRKVEHDPAKVGLAPYHPDTPEMRHDYAQYYDRISKLDQQIGSALAELDRLGLSENTIVFYFSDHGGILPRSKRFLYDTGMRVPMIARFPEKYRHLAPSAPGSTMDELVSFIDLAPTMLSLTGQPIPERMQGRAFLGSRAESEPEYVYGFRDRMDECYDLSRAVVDKNFRYIRNYLPHLPQGRYLPYLYKMPAMQSWHRLYEQGKLNDVQRRFFEPKPVEELYDIAADPYDVNNLADDPNYRETLERMRLANREHILATRDTGFLHEAELSLRSGGRTPFETAQDERTYDLERILEAAELAGSGNPENEKTLADMLGDTDSGVRYWAAVGLGILGKNPRSLANALDDSSPSVRVAAAEALLKHGQSGKALEVLNDALSHPNMYVGLHAADVISMLELELDRGTRKRVEAARKRVRQITNLNAIM